MMSHSPYDLMISMSLDGELAEAEEQELRQHIQVCAICARTWRGLHRVDSMLSRAVDVPVPANFAARVMTRIEVYEHRRRWYPWMVGLFALISLAAAFSIAGPILFFSLGLYETLLQWPVIGTMLSYLFRAFGVIQTGAMFALDALRDWLFYLLSDPVALTVVVTALVLASVWIGLLEGFKALASAQASAAQTSAAEVPVEAR